MTKDLYNMQYDKYGLNELSRGYEATFFHIDYGTTQFAHSSYIKEWTDNFIKGDIKTIFDIGAFEGGDSLRFSSWHPNATIYTVEATPNNYNVLVNKLGNKRSNIKTFNLAFASIDGPITLYQLTFPFNLHNDPNEKLVMGSIYSANDVQLNVHGQKNMQPIIVEGITFDSFCERNNIAEVDVLHIDVEGATYDVLLGMNKILPKIIFTEKERNDLFNKNIGGNEEMIKHLKEKGYRLEKELSNDYLFIHN
jgi:FkbM family methyltransferase